MIDEKGLLSIPKPINTFALELSYLNANRERKTGWLFDTSKQTTHYLLCWVKRNDVNLNDFKLEDIHYVITMLVSRNQLQQYLNNTYQINATSAARTVYTILEEGRSGRLENLSPDSPSRYHFSDYIRPEQPINIVMNKRELIESGSVIFHHCVKRSGISNA